MVLNGDKDTLPHIMIVDDDELVLYSIKAILEKNFDNVTAIVSARKALDSLNINPPDILIIDVVMEEMSGWRFIKEARKRTQNNFIPLVISGYNDEVDLQEKVDSHGALAYLTKPFGAHDISRMVRNTLENHLNFELSR